MTMAGPAPIREAPTAPGADLTPTCFRLLLAGLLAAAAALGSFRLGTPSVWLDEAVSWFNSSGSWERVCQRALATDDMGGVVYAPLLKVWLAAAGDSEAAMRLPSVAATIALVAVMAYIARLLWDRRASVAVGVLTLFHPSVLTASRQARGYIFLLLFSALGLLGLAWQLGRARRAGHVLLGVAGLAVAATHIFGVLVTIGTAAASALLARHAARGGPPAGPPRRGPVVRALLPFLPAGLFAAVWVALEARMVARRLAVFWVPGPLWRNGVVVLVLMVGPIVAGSAVVWATRATARAREVALGLIVVAVPVFAGLLVVSLVARGHHNFVTVRYALPLVLPGALGCGYAVSRLRLAPAAAVLAIGAALSVGHAASHNAWASTARGGQEIRDAAAFLRSHVQPGEAVVAMPVWEWFSLSYYRVPNVRELPPARPAGADAGAPGGPTWRVVFYPDPKRPPAPVPGLATWRFGTLRIERWPRP
jgi:mannosyltransferase